MSDFAGNYSSSDTTQPCKMCFFYRDCLSHAVNCHETMKNVTAKGSFNEMSKKTACMLEQIIESRKKQAWLGHGPKMENHAFKTHVYQLLN